MPGHDLLFIAGLARSGTTALADVLDEHPDVALGLERYKRLWGDRVDEITPDLFERERFFDFSDGLTNLTPELPWAAERIAAVEAKFDSARYHGDKMTTVRARRMWQNLPDARFLLITRDVADVASSWQRRFDDPADTTWGPRSDGFAAVDAWNRAVRRMLKAVEERPGLARVVDYHSFFADPDAPGLRALCAFLDIDVAPVLDAYARVHQRFVGGIRDRDRTLAPDLAAYVEERADLEAYRALRARAV